MKYYTPSHIANFFLKQEKHDITILKLTKLVYITLGYSLSLLNRNLFFEEVEAWKYGPVLPSIYHEFKRFGQEIIDGNSETYSYSKNKNITPMIDKTEKDLNTILEIVWELYEGENGEQLIELTHSRGTPWSLTYDPEIPNKIIPKELIKKYYKLIC